MKKTNNQTKEGKKQKPNRKKTKTNKQWQKGRKQIIKYSYPGIKRIDKKKLGRKKHSQVENEIYKK